jgi:hypothetical protein
LFAIMPTLKWPLLVRTDRLRLLCSFVCCFHASNLTNQRAFAQFLTTCISLFAEPVFVPVAGFSSNSSVHSSDDEMEDGESFFRPRLGNVPLPPASVPGETGSHVASGDPIFVVGPRLTSTSPDIPSILLSPSPVDLDVDEEGNLVASEISGVVPPTLPSLAIGTPAFTNQATKDAFLATLPSAIQSQLNQPFGEDKLTQSFHLQKTGQQTLSLLCKSGHTSVAVKKKLERVFPPARQLRHLIRKHSMVDFSSIQASGHCKRNFLFDNGMLLLHAKSISI